MSSDKLPTVWNLEPHTRAKHDLLRGYLGAWFPILATNNRRLIFLDGFAGPGIYRSGEPGSPTVALNTLLKHAALNRFPNTEFIFVFNEQDDRRYESLVQVLAEEEATFGGWPNNVKVLTENQNFVTFAEELLNGLGGKPMAPVFAFLDPFGYRHVPIDLVSRLMSFGRSELFIYFDYNSTSRFSTAGVVDEHFEALFGTDEFKLAPPAGDPSRKAFIHDLYMKQLSERCGYPYVQSFEMINKSGKTGYFLFFCTRNLVALDKMKTVMWKTAPLGNYQFSDVLAGQDVLFTEEPDTEPLKAALLVDFAGETVSIEQLEDYVIEHTPYIKSHLKTRTLKPMQESGQISGVAQRRANQYPAGTTVRFV